MKARTSKKTARRQKQRLASRQWRPVQRQEPSEPEIDQWPENAQPAVPPVDVRERQLPVGDREDDPRHDGRAERAVEDLGPIMLPSPENAHRVLGELATLYHERFDAQRRHDRVKADLKKISDEIADLSTRIQERIRVATHRTGLPLFADEEG